MSDGHLGQWTVGAADVKTREALVAGIKLACTIYLVGWLALTRTSDVARLVRSVVSETPDWGLACLLMLWMLLKVAEAWAALGRLLARRRQS